MVLVLLLVAPLLAGCIAGPETTLTVRPGDLIRGDLVVYAANGTEIAFPATGRERVACGHADATDGPVWVPCGDLRFVVGPNPPAALPPGWEDARPLPAAVAERLVGLVEGDQRSWRDVLAFGERDPELVRAHARDERIPRAVQGADAYGRNWTVEEGGNDTVRIMPADEDRNATLLVPPWCSPRACLFRSTLVGWTDDALIVRHEPVEGASVHVEALDAPLTVVDVNASAFRVDGNDPRAGRTWSVHAWVQDVRAPSDALRRAPGFAVTTLDGETLTLEGLLGRPVVLEFFASWCPSCVKNTEHLRQLRAVYGDEVVVLAIGVDPLETRAQLASFAREHDATWPIALDRDGTISRDYRVGQLSTEVLVSPAGNIVHVETGVADHERVARILHGLVGAHDHGDGPGQVAPHGPGEGSP